MEDRESPMRATMLGTVIRQFRQLWRPLVVTDIVFKCLGFALLFPLVGLLFRAFLALSGRTVLADTDIVHFLLHPVGWLTLIIVGGASLGILALEQAVLMTISLASYEGGDVTIASAFRFVGIRAPGVFQVTAWIVARVFLLSLPFLAIGGCLYWLLLTDHDINYYLSARPPRFYLAVATIGGTLLALAIVLIRVILNWCLATQVLLYESQPPTETLKTSQNIVHGNRFTILRWLGSWAAVNLTVGAIISLMSYQMGRLLVPQATRNLWTLIVAIGFVLIAWSLLQLAASLFGVITFALVQTHAYRTFGRATSLELPQQELAGATWLPKLRRRWIVTGLVLTVPLAALIGVSAIGDVRLEDDVQITAHRGASGDAPENTMASVRRAIADGADWVEIDVQETRDGVVIVAHDSDLKKVSGVDTKIWEATAEELRSIDIGSYFGPEFSGERVPLLTEVLEECRGKVGVNIELKYYGHNQSLEQRVVDIVEAAGMREHIVVMSLKAEGIAKIKQLRPNWTVGLLTAVAAGDLSRANADFLAVNAKIATPSFIQSAHRRGKQVYTWTVNDRNLMSIMISRGADNLITDYPALAKQVLADRMDMGPVERAIAELAFMFGAVPTNSAEQ